jgi:ankyrin repeat protein
LYAALTVLIYPEHFKKDDKAVAPYAFPFYLIGTTLLFIGMLFCAFIMKRSSKEYYFRPEKPSKIYWVQPGNQNVGDQVFSAFLAVKEGPESSMTTKLEYIKSIRDRSSDRKYLEIYSTLASTLLGFIFQFIGLRGLHASVILAQLGSTFLMAVIRTCLRTERMTPDENKMKDERKLTSHKQQELDCFAFYLEKVESFNLVSLPDQPANMPSPRFMPHAETPFAKQLIFTRAQLARLTSNSNQDFNSSWDEMPIRQMANNLTKTIEKTMDLVSSWGVNLGKNFEFRLRFECRSSASGSLTESPGSYSIGLIRCGDALRWKMDPDELEAILGLWTWSLHKSDEEWQTSTLCRLVGLSESEASRDETYLYFQKWIFRQTEARLVPSDTYDHSRRLFGFGPEHNSSQGDLLAVRTDNRLEAMTAQDIFIQFLKELFLNVKELGGRVDVIPGLQDSLMASSSRIDELVSCFEFCSLGSREDALLCIVPVLRNRNLLPDLAADSPKVRDRREQFIKQGKWQQAFGLLRWLCQRSEGSAFERSVYELGSLCRRALLDNNKAIRQEGLQEICKILKSDIREEFLQLQKVSLPSDWTISHARIEWWRSFSSQLGWLAWSISTTVPGMSVIQPALRSLNAPETLPGSTGTGQDLVATQVGIRALREWLTMRNLEFKRSGEEDDDEYCFEWTVKNRYDGLLYFLLLRWVDLKETFPALIQMGYVLAAKYDSNLAFEILRQQGTDIDAFDVERRSALYNQVAMGDFLASRLLLQNGADPNGSDKGSHARPLVGAAQAGHVSIAELLLQYGANPNMMDNNGTSALWWAMASDHLDIVKLLLSSGAGTEETGYDGLTPLIWAASVQNLQMLEALIEGEANIDARDSDGQTALMQVAFRHDSSAVIRLLLEKGANVNLKDDKGLTALDVAKNRASEAAIAILGPLT